MAKLYYNREEAMARLGVTDEELREMVRNRQLGEFRDAGKLNYKVDEVDRLAAQRSGGNDASGELSLADSADLALSPSDTPIPAPKAASPGGSQAGSPISLDDDAPLELSGSDSGFLRLTESGSDIRLDDTGSAPPKPDPKGGSRAAAKTGTGPKAGTGPRPGVESDILSLDEVDKDAVDSVKKDDTVITNIGISVFDDADLEIAADPMAKTMMTGSDDHAGLEGSGGGSGLLELTRESDDTSLGAELLEGIDMGDTAATVAQTSAAEPDAAPAYAEEEAGLPPAPGLEPAVQTVTVVHGEFPPDPTVNALNGLLIAASLAMGLLGATAISMTMRAWPTYLDGLSQNFWPLLGGLIVAGAIFAGIGYMVGKQQLAGPKPPKPKKEPKPKKGKKGDAAVA